MELQTLTSTRRIDSGEKAETWLRKGRSRDDLREAREVGEEDIEEGGNKLGNKTVPEWGTSGDVGAWDMVGARPKADGLEGAGRG